MLPRGSKRAVILLADATSSDDLIGFLDELSGDRVHVIAAQILPEWRSCEGSATFHEAEDIEAISWVAKANGPVDLIVTLSTTADETHAALWERLFLHLKAGGAYAVLRSAIDPVGSPKGLLARLRNIAALRDGGDPATVEKLDVELAAATGRIVFGRDMVLIGKVAKHFLKVRESEANELLFGRRTAAKLRVLASIPGGEITTPGTVVSHSSAVTIRGIDTTLSYPPLHLREYSGEIGLVANGLLFAGLTVLPDSYRHHLDPVLRNRRTRSVTTEFARIESSVMPTETLPGSYYHLDSENSGHFGHLMTEVVGRLWGWHRAKAEIPDLKAIFRIRFAGERDPVLERRIFTAFGIQEEDIVWVDHPV
jgi:hypothetical protein